MGVNEYVDADVFNLRESLNNFARAGTSMLSGSIGNRDTYCESFKQATHGHLASLQTRWDYSSKDDSDYVEFRIVVKKSELEHLESLKETKKNIEEKILLMTGA